ncbi:MAG TPA: hypothetical protein VEW67_04035 [Thermoleophilaceae bacterium]|nr:hypothetical protein [Thermoleophilaceae bacterium]
MPIVDGEVDVATPGTAVALSSSSAGGHVEIQAKAENSGDVYVGGETIAVGRGLTLAAGDRAELPGVDDLGNVFVDAENAAEGVTFVCVT